MTHTELCKLTAERFVKTMALYEVTMLGMERPDVLNFDSSGFAELYEIKMSRSDFLADRTKEARINPSFGIRRYFVCMGDFIKPEELIGVWDGWGLYHFDGKFHKKKESKRFDADSAMFRSEAMVLVNHIICEKHNVVFAKRVIDNRIAIKEKKSINGLHS